MAYKNGLEENGKIVIISDGARWIKNFKDTYCKGLDVVHILNFSHLKENVYKFANAFSEERTLVRPGLRRSVISSIVGKLDEAFAMTEPLKDKKQPRIPNIHTYLTNNTDCIDYPSYIAAGYFIGSGAIESGNKSTMQSRLKLPGMSWDITTAQYVLSAKMKYESGKWYSEVVPLIFNVNFQDN